MHIVILAMHIHLMARLQGMTICRAFINEGCSADFVVQNLHGVVRAPSGIVHRRHNSVDHGMTDL